jgi:hypothetical protein
MKALFAASFVLLLCFATTTYASDAGPLPSVVDAGRLDSGSAYGDGGLVVAPVLPTPEDPKEYVGALVTSLKDSEWRISIALVLMGVIWAVRKWGTEKVAWLGSKWGGIVLALVLGVVAQVITQLQTGAPWGRGFIMNALILGVLASGFWTMLKSGSEAIKK